MFSWLKDHFIPHEGNDHRPHFLRKEMAAGLVLVIVVFEAIYLVQTLVVIPRSGYLAEVLSSVLVEETNQERTADALGTLSVSPVLEQAAQIKAADMAAKEYFSHNTPEGKTPWYFLQQVGYQYQAAGENLAVNFTESQDVTNAWMNSPSHRANILNGKYTEIGIATARGVYKGSNAIFVVQYFGRPRTYALAAPLFPAATSTAATTSVLTIAAANPKVAGSSSTVSNEPIKELSVPVSVVATPTKITVEDPRIVEVAGAESVKDEPLSETQASEPTVTETVPFASTQENTVLAPAQSTPNAWQRLLASPRPVLTAILAIMGILVLAALLLTIFIKVRVQHPHIIGNGVLILALISFILVLNSLMGGAFGLIL